MKIRFLIVVSLLIIGCCSAGADDSAKEVWNSLVGEKFAKREAFAFVKNDPSLPNVLIYGDSISIAYTPRVRKELEGKANVYRLWCNGGDSSSFIGMMDKMESTMRERGLEGGWGFEWDVIQFNVGLHDLKYVTKGKLDRENGTQVSSLETYEKNLREIVAYLRKEHPKAKLIFATTTPVPEGAEGRDQGDSVKYNEIALKVMASYPDIKVNDLYRLTKPNQPEWWTKPGNVHFSEVGYDAQGKQVAKRVLRALK